MFQLLVWDNKEETNNQNEQLPLADNNENTANNEHIKKEENEIVSDRIYFNFISNSSLLLLFKV